MPPFPDFRATVWWDFDGTLAHRPGIWATALITSLDAVFPDHGLLPEHVDRFLHRGFTWQQPEVLHPHLADADAWWAQLHPVLLEAYLSAGVDDEIALAAANGVRVAFLAPEAWQLLPGAGEALGLARSAGIKNVVVSNHVPELPELIDALGLAPLVDVVINSAVVGAEKPNPLIFRAALAESVANAPLWMVGDNPVADMAGAAAFGIPGILVGSRPEAHGRSALDAARTIVAQLGAGGRSAL